MPTLITGEVEYEKLSQGFPELISQVVEFGADAPSRIGPTKEIVGMILRLWQPQHCLVGRKAFSREFMELESLMLLAGTFDEALIRKAVPRAAELISVATAYGPRVKHQVVRVVDELRDDPASRRAVVYVGRHDDLMGVRDPGLSVGMKAEMPCTQTWQFLIRDGVLHMLVTMRSWDLVWGLCYDVPSFVAMQMAVAKAVGVPLGSYLHHAGSAHVYERHWDVEMWDNEEEGELILDWLDEDMSVTQQIAAGCLETIRQREET